MKPIGFFVDTHDRAKKTFPKNPLPEGFAGFYALHKKACYEEGVVLLHEHVGCEDGRAFCFTMASDAVRRAHVRVSLPFDSITEVATATPGVRSSVAAT